MSACMEAVLPLINEQKNLLLEKAEEPTNLLTLFLLVSVECDSDSCMGSYRHIPLEIPFSVTSLVKMSLFSNSLILPEPGWNPLNEAWIPLCQPSTSLGVLARPSLATLLFFDSKFRGET